MYYKTLFDGTYNSNRQTRQPNFAGFNGAGEKKHTPPTPHIEQGEASVPPKTLKEMTTIIDKISYYLSAKDSQSTIYCTLSEILADIKNGKYQQQIDVVRNQLSIEQYKEEKKKLPMFAASGVFTHRNDDLVNLQEYSNLIVTDFDHFANRQEAIDFKNKLIQYATRLHLWAIFESPSGLGVKAVMVHDNLEPTEHGRMFLQIKRDLFPRTPQFDIKCGNISRTCFVSYDPDLFINTDISLQPYHFIPDSSIEVPKYAKRASNKYIQGSSQKVFTHTNEQLLFHSIIDMKERSGLELKRDADTSLMDYLRKKWDKQFPNAYVDGNRHKSILARAKTFCEVGILIDAAINYFVNTFGRHGISEREIIDMVNYCYNTNEDSWGQYRSFVYELRLSGKQKRIEALRANNPFN